MCDKRIALVLRCCLHFSASRQRIQFWITSSETKVLGLRAMISALRVIDQARPGLRDHELKLKSNWNTKERPRTSETSRTSRIWKLFPQFLIIKLRKGITVFFEQQLLLGVFQYQLYKILAPQFLFASVVAWRNLWFETRSVFSCLRFAGRIMSVMSRGYEQQAEGNSRYEASITIERERENEQLLSRSL